MDINYEHTYTVAYDFDTNDIKGTERRVIVNRLNAFSVWCEDNSKASYLIDNQYNSGGITVNFESEDDCSRFIDFVSSGECWMFLHD